MNDGRRDEGLTARLWTRMLRALGVVREFEIIRPAIEAAQGKVFFDNTCSGGVRDALHAIHARWGGQLVEFAHCSWYPPGNAIWQPSPRGVEPGGA